jgi:AcrR family transcriptional regulator
MNTQKASSSPRLQEKKEQKRAAILRAARAEFARRGYSDARMADIAKAANVAKGTLFLYFERKADMFECLLREALFLDETHFERREGETPFETIRRIVIQNMELAKNHDDVVLLFMTEGKRFPELREMYFRVVLDRFLNIVKKEVEKIESPNAAPLRKYPQLVLAATYGAVILNVLLEADPQLDDVDFVAEYFNLLRPLFAS